MNKFRGLPKAQLGMSGTPSEQWSANIKPAVPDWLAKAMQENDMTPIPPPTANVPSTRGIMLPERNIKTSYDQFATPTINKEEVNKHIDRTSAQLLQSKKDPFDVFYTMRMTGNAMNWLSNSVDRKRQMNDYMENIYEMGMNNPENIDDYQPKYNNMYFQKGGSIVDYLNSKGQDSSFATRKQMFSRMYEGENYAGSAAQNLKMLAAISSNVKDGLLRGNQKTQSDASISPVSKTSAERKLLYDIFENDRQVFFAKKAALANNGRFVMTDTGNHMTYYGTYDSKSDKFNANKFEVLTGKNNKDLVNTNMPLRAMEKMSKKEREKHMITPAGFYDMKEGNAYGYTSFGLPGTGGVAYHKTYVGPDDMTRQARYGNNNDNDNNITYGCINCEKPSLDALNNFIGNQPLKTLIMNSERFFKENAEAMKANSPEAYKLLNLGFRLGGSAKFRGK